MKDELVVRYSNTSKFSATIIARGVDSSTIAYILKAVLEKDFQHVRRLKDSFNFECIVIDNETETVV